VTRTQRSLCIAIAILAAAALLLREPLREFAEGMLTCNMFAAADNDSFDPGPAIGSRFPGLRARLDGREITLIEEFAGGKGALLVVLDSLASPYSRKQLLQLQEYRDHFGDAGLGVVVLSADTPRDLQDFAQRRDIDLPLLADDHTLSLRTLGLLENAAAGESGRPEVHPGTLVIDMHGIIAGKFFLSDPARRIDAAAALALALKLLDT